MAANLQNTTMVMVCIIIIVFVVTVCRSISTSVMNISLIIGITPTITITISITCDQLTWPECKATSGSSAPRRLRGATRLKVQVVAYGLSFV